MFGSDQNLSCDCHVYYKDLHFCYPVHLTSTIEDLKWAICDNWRILSPSCIVVNYIQGGEKIPILADISLISLAALHSKLKSSYFEVHVESFEAAVGSSSSNGASSSTGGGYSSSLLANAKRSYAGEKEVSRALLSDDWDKVFDDLNQEFNGIEAVRLAFDKYVLRTGYKLIKKKNELSRFTAKCKKEGCSWFVH
ncbi:hypothetical protein MKW94_017972, partial [Papaver nudicaule]|nr:hypothetical protein [Papaver nudicaule]